MTSEGLFVSVTGANGYPIVDLIDDLDLQEELLRGINSYGFEKPSAVQQRGIRPVLDGRDTIGQAQSGRERQPPSSSDLFSELTPV